MSLSLKRTLWAISCVISALLMLFAFAPKSSLHDGQLFFAFLCAGCCAGLAQSFKRQSKTDLSSNKPVASSADTDKRLAK